MPFLVAAMLVGIAWLARHALARSPITGALLLLVGTAAAFYPVLTVELGFGSWLPFAARLSLSNHFIVTGAYIAVLGLALILKVLRHGDKTDTS